MSTLENMFHEREQSTKHLPIISELSADLRSITEGDKLNVADAIVAIAEATYDLEDGLRAATAR